MKVFKFGGASVRDAAGIRNVASVISRFAQEPLVIVVSAAGKTTNALESLVKSYFAQDGQTENHLQQVKDYHYEIADELFGGIGSGAAVYDDLNDIFVEIDWVIETRPQDPFDFVYDQVVSVGEMLSTRIVAAFLQQQSIGATWLDVRDVIKTDNHYRDAAIRWAATEQAAKAVLLPLLASGHVLTQGFLGVTPENYTTTLGREGSDYTAAILAYCLDAKSMTVWKDVPGVLTADPRLFPEAERLARLSYREAIEMTYYGAQVIHPKTIQPLQRKSIPMWVKSFLAPEGEGTFIAAEVNEEGYPPIIVVKKQQALLQIASRDFHFLDEARLAHIFALFATHNTKVNMMQNTAVSFCICLDDNRPERLASLLTDLQADYHVSVEHNLELLTIRHYDAATLDRLLYGRQTLLEEKIGQTAQMAVKALPVEY